MNKKSCPLCSSITGHKLFSTNGYDLLRCDECELTFIHPFPGDEDQRIEGVSNNSLEDITVIDPEKYSVARQVYYQELFPLVEPSFKNASTLLDIGCGTGHLLKLAGQKYAMKCTGIELNSARAKYARDNTGFEVFQVPVEKFQSDQKFDVITLIDVLSHIPSFEKLFKSVSGLLARDGKFVIKTGEVAGDVKRGSVFDWEVPDHVHFLGLKTINVIAKKYGFTIASHHRVAHADELYTRARFLTKGRSKARDLIKLILAYTPFALAAMKKNYIKKNGKSVYSSVIVLSKVG
ncbi:MAG: class I SAM-dependent methyltransferase [Phycisphaerae bacterium]|nr:class I SAM-dependent methyltransferase [Phycisphaerae bacterium]